MSFVNYVKEHIERENFEDVLNHGMDTGWSGFIYSTEMREVYIDNMNEIEEILDNIEYRDSNTNLGLNTLIDRRVWAAAYSVVQDLSELPEDEEENL